MDKISIVIPIYNAAKYIGDTIDSIKRQTHHNFELLLIDDGSTDASLLLCKKFAIDDKRIQVFSKQNGGVSSARNMGLSEATSNFIIFIDADDLLYDNMLEVLYTDITEHNADIAMCGADIVRNGEIVEKEYGTNQKEILDRKSAIRRFLKRDKFSIGVWTKLFRKDILKDVKFEEGRKMNEDKFFIFIAMIKSALVVYNDVSLYRYIKRENSATGKYFDRHWFDMDYFATQIYWIVCKEIPELELEARYQLLMVKYNLIHFMYTRTKAIEEHQEEYEKLISELRTLDMNGMETIMSFKKRVLVQLLCRFESLYRITKHRKVYKSTKNRKVIG